MSDVEILDLYWAKNSSAISAAKEKYGSDCYSLAMGLCGNAAMAAEVVLEAHNAVWNEIPPNRPKNLGVFLLNMTRKFAINLSNGTCDNERIRQIDNEISKWVVDIPLYTTELGAIIDSFLRKLTDVEQIIFVCRYWYFNSVGEISKNINLPEAKIQSILRSIGEQLLLRFMEVERIIEK